MTQQQIINTIKRKLESDADKTVAIAAYYGSFADGSQHRLSDVDFFFIPENDAGYGLTQQFIIDNIGYDFFPLSWSRVEAIAKFDDSMTALLLDSTVFYAKNEAVQQRFIALREAALKQLESGNPYDFYARANKQLERASHHYLQMMLNQADPTLLAIEKMHFLTSLFSALVQMNQRYLHKGWGKNMPEIANLPHLPAGFLIKQANFRESEGQDSLQAALGLYQDVADLCLCLESKLAVKNPDYDFFVGCYEEIKSTFNKILIAIERGEWDVVTFSSLSAMVEIYTILVAADDGIWHSQQQAYQLGQQKYQQIDLPDLLPALQQSDWTLLADQVRLLDEKLLAWLRSNGVPIKIYDDVDAFAAALQDSSTQ